MTLVTAESCTGGLLAATIARRPGASKIFERGFITYSNAAKHEELDVPKNTLKQHGAVSAQTAEAMASGALKNSHADLAIAITGIAGPDGGTAEKPVGTVYFGYAAKNSTVESSKEYFENQNRENVQTQSTITAIKHLINILEKA